MRKYPGTIFLAEDDSDDVLFFKLALKQLQLNYNLTVFVDGHEIVSALQTTDTVPDLIFMDVNMPRLSGIDALQQIRAMPPLQAIPVITYSTSKNNNDILQAFKVGASLYLVKPSNFDNLVNLVGRILNFDWNLFKKPEIEEFVLMV